MKKQVKAGGNGWRKASARIKEKCTRWWFEQRCCLVLRTEGRDGEFLLWEQLEWIESGKSSLAGQDMFEVLGVKPERADWDGVDLSRGGTV